MRAIVWCALAVIIPLQGCIVVDGAETFEVRVVVTRDHGTTRLLDSTVAVTQGASVIDALHAAATVETAHGGAFVIAIDGHRSSFPDRRVDWFYEHNGVHGPVGAADVGVNDGDLVLWDLRPWTNGGQTPGLLVAWPRPLTVGWAGQRLGASVHAMDGADGHIFAVLSMLDALGAGQPQDDGHVITVWPGAPELADHEPAAGTLRSQGGRIVVGGEWLSPPWGVIARTLPGPQDAIGATRFAIGASDEVGLGLLLDALAIDGPRQGHVLAVNGTRQVMAP